MTQLKSRIWENYTDKMKTGLKVKKKLFFILYLILKIFLYGVYF